MRLLTSVPGLALLLSLGVLLLPACTKADDGQLPAALTKTWRAFQASVREGDAKGLAKISRFPIRANDFGGAIASPAVLEERFEKIFFDLVRTCVATKEPIQIPGYPGHILDCNNDGLALGFGFESFENQYLFSYIDNANAE